MDSFTPQQTIELISRTGTKKAHMRLDKLLINSFMTGPLLGFGCAIVLSVNASPWYQENAPGLIRMVGALLFPVGLTMIVLSGSDLFTSNVMYMLTALLGRRIHITDLALSWVVSFLGNLAGSLFSVAVIFGYGGVFEETEVYRQAVLNFATQKAVQPMWHQIFLRAIGANWLVCFAVFSATQTRELVSKVIGIWWPTAVFVGLGLDHVVANMFFMPMAIFVGSPNITVGYYIWKSMIPTGLGNIVGGGLFVATAYWYLYLTGEGSVAIDFDTGTVRTAVEGGAGPLTITGRDPSELQNGQHSGLGSPQFNNSGSGTSGNLVSAIGKELSDSSPYAKTRKERIQDEKSAATPKEHV